MDHQPLLCPGHSHRRLWQHSKGCVQKYPHESGQFLTEAGYDEGGFSASVKLDSFTADYNLISSHWENDPTGLANRKANITSFNVLGAAFGALFALDLNDRLGRLNAWRLAVLVWASGTFIQVFASGIYGLLLFARIWSGLGAGLLTVVVPLYLSEIAPTRTRGLVVSCYMVILLLILTVGEYHISPP